MTEVKKTDCSGAADGILASRPRVDRLGPEEAATWAQGLRAVTARPACSEWEQPPERERISGIDDY
jgi:hypothetical protein